MNAAILPIGSISLFTNVSERQQYLFDAELNDQVSTILVEWVEDELKKGLLLFQL